MESGAGRSSVGSKPKGSRGGRRWRSTLCRRESRHERTEPAHTGCARDRGRAGSRADRRGGAPVLRCPGIHGGPVRSRFCERRRPPASRARPRNRLGAPAPGAGHRPQVAGRGHELGLRLRPLAGDRGVRDRPLPAEPGSLPPAPERDVHLRTDRLRLLRGPSDGPAAARRPRHRGHGDRVLARLPGAAAARPDQPVRGLSEPPRGLEHPPRDRHLPGHDPALRTGLCGGHAGGHGLRGRRDREPLRPRRRRRHGRRARGATGGDADNCPYTERR